MQVSMCEQREEERHEEQLNGDPDRVLKVVRLLFFLFLLFPEDDERGLWKELAPDPTPPCRP